jgi:hypothetical protein
VLVDARSLCCGLSRRLRLVEFFNLFLHVDKAPVGGRADDAIAATSARSIA